MIELYVSKLLLSFNNNPLLLTLEHQTICPPDFPSQHVFHLYPFPCFIICLFFATWARMWTLIALLVCLSFEFTIKLESVRNHIDGVIAGNVNCSWSRDYDAKNWSSCLYVCGLRIMLKYKKHLVFAFGWRIWSPRLLKTFFFFLHQFYFIPLHFCL